MGVGRYGGLPNLLGSIAVLFAAGAIGLGLPALDRALPGARPVPDGEPYEVGAGVRLIPPPGAVLDVTKTRPGGDRGTVLFLAGGVRFVVVVMPFTGSLAEAAERLRAKIAATEGYRVTGVEGAVRTRTGLTGRGGSYGAPGRLGRYAVFRAGSLVIEVTVSGAYADFDAALTGVDASIQTLSHRGPP